MTGAGLHTNYDGPRRVAGPTPGSVTVNASGGAETCSASVAVGSCAITLLAAGTCTLTTSYPGDIRFNASSDSQSQTVLERLEGQVLHDCIDPRSRIACCDGSTDPTGVCGALYHLTAPGDRRETVYEDDADREQFLALLGDVIAGFNWRCHAYCLMSNHCHLVVETPDGNLAKRMRQLNGVFTQASNRRHGRTGHLFQGRYKAVLVDADSYLRELTRYVVLDPVRTGMVAGIRRLAMEQLSGRPPPLSAARRRRKRKQPRAVSKFSG